MGHDNKRSNATYWEEVDGTRWGAYISEIQREAILTAHRLAGDPAAAIEVGADGGRWSSMLDELGWDMTCTDIDPEGLDACKRRVPAATCLLVSPEDSEIPCRNDSANLVLCIEVPPVIQADWFIDESSRVLRKDGLVVGVFWNRLSIRGLLSHIKARAAGDFDYYGLSYRAWRTKLSGNYSLVHEEGCCWFPFGRASDSPLVPYFVRLEKLLGLRKLVAASPWIVFVAQKRSTGAGLA